MTTATTHNFASRMDQLPPYLFAQLEQAIAAKQAEGHDVISLGIGDPDQPTPQAVIEAGQKAMADTSLHQYPSNKGLPQFREAVAQFYQQRFGVTLDTNTQIVPALGGKEAVFHIGFVCLDPGDVALLTDPGYPVYTGSPLLAGAQPYPLAINADNNFKPDLEAIPADVLASAKMIYLNYPNNPTGAVVEEHETFFADVVAFAKRHDLIVVHDNAYSEISFDGYTAPSFLATPGAIDVGVEIFSLSKAWNMTGWRAGAVVGNDEIVSKYWTYKTNVDSGMFGAVQMASAAALTEVPDFPAEMSAIYERRRNLLVSALTDLGIDVTAPKGSIYLWVPAPEGYDDVSFTELVLEQTHVVISPGSSYGASGEGCIRMSLSTPDDRLLEAVDRMSSRLRVSQ